MYLNAVKTLSYFSPQCSSQNASSATVTLSPKRNTKSKFAYSVKVINPSRKTAYTVRKLKAVDVFTSVDALKDQINKMLDDEVEAVGFIEPGHGLKGKQRWLVGNEDLDDMYLLHKSKREITLWCYSRLAAPPGQTEQPKKKRSLSDSEVPPAKAPRGNPAAAVSRSKHDQCAMKVQEVEKIVQRLKEKHESNFSIEKLHAWAHMIHLNKHSSYETPPELPYFVGRSQAKNSSTSQCTQESTATTSGTVSPTKRIGLRSECINQLDRWHSLLEKGAITQEQYDSLLHTILGDITKTT